MLPEVQIQLSRRQSTKVAIIRRPGHTQPHYWLPFRDQDAKAAFAINETEIIAYGDGGRLVVYDLAAERVVREGETDRKYASAKISLDRSALYVLAQDRVSFWQTQSLTMTAEFNGLEIVGEERKVLHFKSDGFFQRMGRKEVDMFQGIRDIVVLRDGRIGVLRRDTTPAIYFVNPHNLTVKARPISHELADVFGKTRDFVVLPDGRLGSVTHGHKPVIYLTDLHMGTFESHPVAGDLSEAVKALGLPADSLVKWAQDPGVDRHVRSLGAGGFSLSSLTEPEISRALEATAAQFDHDLTKYIVNDQLILAYTYKRRDIDEKELFAKIVEDRLTGTVPALRRLLSAYLDGLTKSGLDQPWYYGDEGEAALCHPLRALMLLDGSASTDVMRAYLTKRDQDHECFCSGVLFPELRRNGWATEDDLRLGIVMAWHEIYAERGPSEGSWKAGGLIETAPSIVSGERFAEMVYEEWNGIDGPENWGEYSMTNLVTALPKGSPFTDATTRHLKSLLPSSIEVPWDQSGSP